MKKLNILLIMVFIMLACGTMAYATTDKLIKKPIKKIDLTQLRPTQATINLETNKKSIKTFKPFKPKKTFNCIKHTATPSPEETISTVTDDTVTDDTVTMAPTSTKLPTTGEVKNNSYVFVIAAMFVALGLVIFVYAYNPRRSQK